MYRTFLLNVVEVPTVIARHPGIDFTKSFKSLHHKGVDPVTRNVSFKLIHDALPLADRLHARHLSKYKECVLCGKGLETIKHLFFSCPHVTSVLSKISEWFDLFTGGLISSLDFDTIRFMNLPKISPNIMSVLIILLMEFKYFVWIIRNKRKFEHKPLSDLNISCFFFSRIKFQVQADYSRLSEAAFKAQWCRDDIICHLDGNKIVFTF